MKLAIVSHKLCWRMPDVSDLYQTDGGFPLQIKAISELFDETRVVVPCDTTHVCRGISPLVGRNLRVIPLTVPNGAGLRRKLSFPFWLTKNSRTILREIRSADAVHAPVPGDVGTVGMLLAMLLRKPLFVRHCGNWFVRRTAAEWFWRWAMERFAGGRNVMLATGGSDGEPSAKNADIKWIFSTSLTHKDIIDASVRQLPADGKVKLIIACRQEKGKGTDLVINSLALISDRFPGATLDVVGDGAFLNELKTLARTLNLEERITFHGRVQQKEVFDLLKKSHVFCYPTGSEGFPKVVLEALASGLPVITTRVSVLPKLIGKEFGVLLDPPTPENLSTAVEYICREPKSYMRMSQSAIAAAQNYSLENWRDSIGETLRKSWQVASLSSAAEAAKEF